MTDNLPEALEPYPEISSKAYEHPADRAATAALKAVPMLDTVVRKLIEYRYERALRQFYLGNSVKISERQLSDVWASYQGVSRVLDMPSEYDIYVSSSPRVGFNAVTIGSQNPIIVFGAPMLRELGAAEQRGVIAHELGHILSDHMVYMTALEILLGGVNLPGVVGLPLRAVRAVLLEWSRAAELSCDRAAILAVRDPRIVCRTLMVVASGMPASSLDLDAFMAQAMEYENWEDSHDRVRRFFIELGATHSFAVRRVSEVMRWVQSGEYDRILRGEYRRRGEETNVREEAGDAMEFYAERFRALFRELGDNVTSLGSQVGDVSQKAADWLRNRGSSRSE
ncbi:MAG TPA: M48 family metallopeptidase [Solirubrobacteraceae bacterium]